MQNHKQKDCPLMCEQCCCFIHCHEPNLTLVCYSFMKVTKASYIFQLICCLVYLMLMMQAETGRKGDEDVLPYLSPRSGGRRSRPSSVPAGSGHKDGRPGSAPARGSRKRSKSPASDQVGCMSSLRLALFVTVMDEL